MPGRRDTNGRSGRARRDPSQIVVGIPRGLLYFHYQPLWSTYLASLGLRVRVSDPTDRSLLEKAQTVTASDLCLPVKAFLAHVARLIDQVDWLFLPRITSVDPENYMCPKILGLTDMVRNIFPSLPGLLDPVINLKPPKPQGTAAALDWVGRHFTDSRPALDRAWSAAVEAQKEFNRNVLHDPRKTAEWFEAGKRRRLSATEGRPHRVALIGRRYLIFDQALSHHLLGILEKQGVEILTAESVPDESARRLARKLPKKVYWELGKDLVAAGMYFAESPEVDGVINVSSFGCGQDSFTSKLVEHYVTKGSSRPFLNLVIDEHDADAGMKTRLEAFLDMLEDRRKGKGRPLPEDATRVEAGRVAALGAGAAEAGDACRNEDRMHLTIPHMGHLHIGFENVFRNLGVHITMPPRPNKEAAWLGARHSPDCACLPFKLNLGNMIQALNQGATDVIMPGGFGPCRFGYYGSMQELILRDMGYKFRMGSADDPDSLRDMLATVRRIAGLRSRWDSYRVFLFILYRIALVDHAVAHSLRVRPREREKRSTDRVLRQSIDLVDATRRFVDLLPTWRRIDKLFRSIPIDRDRPVVRIGLVGEIFMVLENHANMNIEERLGEMGVEVHRGLWLSDWLNDRFRFMPFRRHTFRWALNEAAPYLYSPCGGESVNSVGHAVHFAKERLDGIIHLMPFTCMPELVAQTIMNRISEEYGIPVLTLAFDEHTSSGAVQTRIEAFVDCIRRRATLLK